MQKCDKSGKPQDKRNLLQHYMRENAVRKNKQYIYIKQ